MKAVLLFLFALTTPLFADALWDKASSLVEAAKAWTPSLTVTTMTDLDDKGVARDITVTTTRFASDAKGKPTKQNLSVVKNGVTSKPDAVSAASKAPEGPNDPLEASARKLTAVEAPVSAAWNGKDTQVYAYRFTPPSGWGLKGRIWVDKATGVPVHRESIMDPRPPFVDEISFVQDSSLDAQGFVRTDVLDMTFKGSFLGLKKSMGILSEIKEYRRNP
jgi:hypothetical protein